MFFTNYLKKLAICAFIIFGSVPSFAFDEYLETEIFREIFSSAFSAFQTERCTGAIAAQVNVETNCNPTALYQILIASYEKNRDVRRWDKLEETPGFEGIVVEFMKFHDASCINSFPLFALSLPDARVAFRYRTPPTSP